jgi:hypothetical protein
MLSSGRVVPFGALLTLNFGPYFLPTARCSKGFVASIFFDFFKVFLAILFPPRLICPVGHRPTYMQSNRQTSQPIRQSATCSICDTSRCGHSASTHHQARAALN